MPPCALFGSVASAELVDLASGIHDFLLTGVERVAGGADFDTEVASSCGACFEGITAAAGDGDLFVLWVYFRFHGSLRVSRDKKIGKGY